MVTLNYFLRVHVCYEASNISVHIYLSRNGNGITCAIVPHSNAPETLPQILSTRKDLVKDHLLRTFD